jgi:hypothetical protein
MHTVHIHVILYPHMESSSYYNILLFAPPNETNIVLNNNGISPR